MAYIIYYILYQYPLQWQKPSPYEQIHNYWTDSNSTKWESDVYIIACFIRMCSSIGANNPVCNEEAALTDEKFWVTIAAFIWPPSLWQTLITSDVVCCEIIITLQWGKETGGHWLFHLICSASDKGLTRVWQGSNQKSGLDLYRPHVSSEVNMFDWQYVNHNKLSERGMKQAFNSINMCGY
jgi:hypothetical protein